MKFFVCHYKIIFVAYIVFAVGLCTNENVIETFDAESSQTSESKDAAKSNDTLTSNQRKSRTLNGLLGFLTGYKLAQAFGPTSYHADLRESPQLSLFSKLFDGALHLTFIKFPHLHPVPPPLYNQLQTFQQLPQNQYATNFQQQSWYPPLPDYGNIGKEEQSDEDRPALTNFNNRLDILPNDKHLVPKDNPKDTYNKTINKTVNRNITSNKKDIEDSRIVDKAVFEQNDDDVDEIETGASTETKYELVQFSSDYLKAGSIGKGKLKIDTRISNTTTSSTTTAATTTTSTTTTEKYKNVTFNEEGQRMNNSAIPVNTTIIIQEGQDNKTNSSELHPSFYPYPYYHHFTNPSRYEDVSIAESNVSHENFLKQQGYYDEHDNLHDKYPSSDNDEFHVDYYGHDIPPYPNTFKPQNYHYNLDNVYRENPNGEFSRKEGGTGFVPLGNLNHI